MNRETKGYIFQERFIIKGIIKAYVNTEKPQGIMLYLKSACQTLI